MISYIETTTRSDRYNQTSQTQSVIGSSWTEYHTFVSKQRYQDEAVLSSATLSKYFASSNGTSSSVYNVSGLGSEAGYTTYFDSLTASSSSSYDLTVSDEIGSSTTISETVTRRKTTATTQSSSRFSVSSSATITVSTSYAVTTSTTYTTTRSTLEGASYSFSIVPDLWINTVWMIDTPGELIVSGGTTIRTTTNSTGGTTSTTIRQRREDGQGFDTGMSFAAEMSSTAGSKFTDGIVVSSGTTAIPFSSFSSYTTALSQTYIIFSGTATATVRTSTSTTAAVAVSSVASATQSTSFVRFSTTTVTFTMQSTVTTSYTTVLYPGYVESTTGVGNYLVLTHRPQWVHTTGLSATTVLIHGDMITSTIFGTLTRTTITNPHYTTSSFTFVGHVFHEAAPITETNIAGGSSMTRWTYAALYTFGPIEMFPNYQTRGIVNRPHFLPGWQALSARAASNIRFLTASFSGPSINTAKANADSLFVGYGESISETMGAQMSAASVEQTTLPESATNGLGGHLVRSDFTPLIYLGSQGWSITTRNDSTSGTTTVRATMASLITASDGVASAFDQPFACTGGSMTNDYPQGLFPAGFRQAFETSSYG